MTAEAASRIKAPLDGMTEFDAGHRAQDLPDVADYENWDQRLGFLMHDVSRLRRSVFDRRVHRFGITRSQWWILIYIARNPGVTQTELAKTLDIGKAALGALVERLSASGMVVRRSDPTDGRVSRVHLAAKGNRIIKKMQVESDALSEEILGGLSASERHALADLLHVVKVNLLAIKD